MHHFDLMLSIIGEIADPGYQNSAIFCEKTPEILQTRKKVGQVSEICKNRQESGRRTAQSKGRDQPAKNCRTNSLFCTKLDNFLTNSLKSRKRELE